MLALLSKSIVIGHTAICIIASNSHGRYVELRKSVPVKHGNIFGQGQLVTTATQECMFGLSAWTSSDEVHHFLSRNKKGQLHRPSVL